MPPMRAMAAEAARNTIDRGGCAHPVVAAIADAARPVTPVRTARIRAAAVAMTCSATAKAGMSSPRDAALALAENDVDAKSPGALDITDGSRAASGVTAADLAKPQETDDDIV